MDSPHKGPVMRQMSPCHDVIMKAIRVRQCIRTQFYPADATADLKGLLSDVCSIRRSWLIDSNLAVFRDAMMARVISVCGRTATDHIWGWHWQQIPRHTTPITATVWPAGKLTGINNL